MPTHLTCSGVASARHTPPECSVRLSASAGWRTAPAVEWAAAPNPLVEVSWEQAVDLVSDELARVYAERGLSAACGASYGWASAGRFPHAQSQIHRPLNNLDGYVAG
ncbi:hypothetical protein [Streptomyces sp. NPDC058335]|uniref:hypothetical protein n=1 Tax=Streptomyces sp. NPDC058335 TaxID=3346451 RepID=UPI00365ADBFE